MNEYIHMTDEEILHRQTMMPPSKPDIMSRFRTTLNGLMNSGFDWYDDLKKRNDTVVEPVQTAPVKSTPHVLPKEVKPGDPFDMKSLWKQA